MKEKDPYEYICMSRPLHDYQAENRHNKTNRLGDDELNKKYEEGDKRSSHDQPASERPDHKWILMRRSWMELCNASRGAAFRSPDNFGMYIYNDFEGYGLLEMVENFIVEYHKEFKKKAQDLRDMWIPLVAFVHWEKMVDVDPLLMIDDGERLSATLDLAGRAFLSMLNALDRASQLKPDSDFKDLGLVMGMFASIASDFEDAYNTEDELDWRVHILKYANDKGIEIDVSFVGKILAQEFEDDSDDGDDGKDGKDEWPKAAKDRWVFLKKFKEHKQHHGPMGGTHSDITKFPRAQRAEYAFAKKDPLADVPSKVLKEGTLMLQ